MDRPMVVEQAQTQIEVMKKTLNEAKSYSGLGPDDPAVIELERIIQNKIAELAASSAKTSADNSASEAASDPHVATSATNRPR
ncbi:MAG TPA: hypothetical protein VGI45_35425 [Terracidiphilus sp.]|jgi:hypothetical protein